MPGRIFNLGGYRYGFNGKENDSEVKGDGNQQDYGMRIYDPRSGKFLSVDPISDKYPELTPYQFASNRPIEGIDLDGLEFSGGYMPGYSGNTIAVSRAIAKQKDDNKREEMTAAYHKINMGQLKLDLAATYLGMLVYNPTMIFAGAAGGIFNGLYGYSTEKSPYEIKKSIFSGFISGSLLAFGNGAVSNAVVGAGSGGLGELIDQSIDESYGVYKSPALKNQEFQIGVMSGAIAGPLGGIAAKETTKIFNTITKNLISKTETKAYRNIVKKAILERIPRIGNKELNAEIKNEIKKQQNSILNEIATVKAAFTKTIGTGLDISQEKAKDKLKEDAANNKK